MAQVPGRGHSFNKGGMKKVRVILYSVINKLKGLVLKFLAGRGFQTAHRFCSILLTLWSVVLIAFLRT